MSTFATVPDGSPSGSGSDIPDAIRHQLTDAFRGMMSVLHREQGASLRIEILQEPGIQSFIEAHTAALDHSMQSAQLSPIMKERLSSSNYVFSGIKTFHELHEAFPSLLDEGGNRKPFEQFLNDVRSIDQTYNHNYLRAEYNFVNASADMAARWEQFQQDGDRYNLQYRTANDGKVRPEHAELHGVTLPPSDPFWSVYYPPNGWNCRCTVVQVRKSKYPTTDPTEAMERGERALSRDKKGMFRFNPGMTGKSFPDYNPYTISRCRDCDIASKLASGVFDNELCQACQLVRSCMENRDEVIPYGEGQIRINRMVNHEDSDFNKLMDVARHFAEEGATVELTPKMYRPPRFRYECVYGDLIGTKFEGKCPDLRINGVWYEHEGFISTNPKNAFRNMMRDGLLQSNRLIIDRPELTERYMRHSIVNRVMNEGQDIQEVWLRNNDGTLSLLYKKTDG